MSPRLARVLLWSIAIAIVSVPLSPVRSAEADPAARGLDSFLHAPTKAAPGTTLPLDVLAYGFPEVTRAVPLANATVEAAWDPEHLGATADAPPPIRVTTDAEGRARLDVPVPEGEPLDLELLVGIRHGAHARTQSIKVHRGASSYVELHTTDTRVVPGSTISAWVRAIATKDDHPIAGTKVRVELQEGGYARHSQVVTTDPGGMAMVRIPIPVIDELRWHWELTAKVDAVAAEPSSVQLTPREETPGMPTLAASFHPAASGVFAGDRVPWSIRVVDGAGQALVGTKVRYWLGQKGLELAKVGDEKSDKEWARVSTEAVTDGAGEVHGTLDAPTLVKATGTGINMVVRAEVEGHPLESHARVEIGLPSASASLQPEANAIVPGLAQRMMLRVEDGRGEGVKGDFAVTGDGLDARVTTDERGEAEIAWNVPLGVGALRNVGPCASGVAAAILVRALHEIPALGTRAEPFNLCVQVDRDAEAIVRAEPLVVHPGEPVKLTVARAFPQKKALSVIASSRSAVQATSAWIAASANEVTITMPSDAAEGVWDLSASLPEGARESRTVMTRFFVVPKVLPRLEVVRTGGRAAPLGKVEVEAQLSDGHGHPLVGSVSLVVVDAKGGGVVRIDSLDTRSRLCGAFGARDRCDDFLEGGAALEPLRREALATNVGAAIGPGNDPGAHASKDLLKAFAAVLRSLEGAVYESSQSADRLIDARRKQNGTWKLNPELFTLVTDAMEDPPLTPGGERLGLSDLALVDPQVTFDNVARRVTRLKLFRVLSAVRAYRREKQLDPDEPVFKDPNALLRRIVRDGRVGSDLLLDPWGGTIQFVRATGAPTPFLSVVHGFELHAPGPDGRVGTEDDVRDPFERVLKSGTPYANAVEEDRIVDAKWDMDVSDPTVESWQKLFDELTGTALGNAFGAGGIGLSGVGEGGGGSGSGIGLGRLGTIGHGRGTSGISTGDAYFAAPVRTDDSGRVKLTIPLGDVETTWRAAFIGVPDTAGPAATTIDIASELPLSARVNAGASWIEGDSAAVSIIVRNRTAQPVNATIDVAAEGVATLDQPKNAPLRAIAIGPNGVATTTVRVSAAAVGHASLRVTTSAAGIASDTLTHSWEVLPAGEKRILAQSAWVDDRHTLGIELDEGYRLRDAPVLVLERGYLEPLTAALDSLEPERQTSTSALLDSFDASKRIERWAIGQPAPRGPALAAIANAFAKRANARYGMLSEGTGKAFTEIARRRELEGSSFDPNAADRCPPSIADRGGMGDGLDPLEVEPPPSPDVPPCWGAFILEASAALEWTDSVRLSRALLALAERPAHAALTASLADRLRDEVSLSASGTIKGPSARADRAIVYAALLRTVKLGRARARPETIFSQISQLRDGNGGYGSSDATLSVVRALLASQLEGHGMTRARVTIAASKSTPAFDQSIDVPANGWASVPLPANALGASIAIEGPAVIARLERPVLRLWSRPPPPQSSPVNVEVVWPTDVRPGKVGTLRVMLRHSLSRTAEVDVRIPLPPGVSLAAPISAKEKPLTHVGEVQGVLAFRWSVDSNVAVVDVPVRLGLAGRFTVPEATARIARESYAPAVAPARPLEVR